MVFTFYTIYEHNFGNILFSKAQMSRKLLKKFGNQSLIDHHSCYIFIGVFVILRKPAIFL